MDFLCQSQQLYSDITLKNFEVIDSQVYQYYNKPHDKGSGTTGQFLFIDLVIKKLRNLARILILCIEGLHRGFHVSKYGIMYFVRRYS